MSRPPDPATGRASTAAVVTLAGLWALLTLALLPVAWLGIAVFVSDPHAPAAAWPVAPAGGGGAVGRFGVVLGEALVAALPRAFVVGTLAVFTIPFGLAWLALPRARRGSFPGLALAAIALGALALTSPTPPAPWVQVVCFLAPALMGAAVLRALVAEVVGRARGPSPGTARG